MKTIKLSSGCEVKVGVRHGTDVNGKRFTEVVVRDLDKDAPPFAWAIAMCSEGDNFCKRVGRKLAAKRLLEKLRKGRLGYVKNDLAQVFYAICPEFGPKVSG